MEIELREQSLTLSGNLDFKLLKNYREISKGRYDAILIVQFSGDHGYGSGGNDNSGFMRTVVAAAMGLNIFNGFILDLRELEYSFGDSIYSVIDLPFKIIDKDFPYRILVSDKCEKGINSLLEWAQTNNTFAIEKDLNIGIQEIYKILDKA